MIKKYTLLHALFLSSFIAYAEPLDPVELLSNYIGVDTVNPPGNESRAVDFYAKILRQRALNFLAQRVLRAEEIFGPASKAVISQP